ncbi:transcription factor SCREAM2-like isoform X1 [Olea europaea subsp. europaea]|nr:transcription factor SCREAM2-like isoform X1 [Olea europaea subsp. europaea]
MNTASIVVDASRYIEELKERVERLDQDVVTLQNSNEENSLTAQVKVESLEKGFLINVFSEKNCPGLLVSILEAFEELGLEVLDARVSCSDNFRLEAVSEVKKGLSIHHFFLIECLYI